MDTYLKPLFPSILLVGPWLLFISTAVFLPVPLCRAACACCLLFSARRGLQPQPRVQTITAGGIMPSRTPYMDSRLNVHSRRTTALFSGATTRAVPRIGTRRAISYRRMPRLSYPTRACWLVCGRSPPQRPDLRLRLPHTCSRVYRLPSLHCPFPACTYALRHAAIHTGRCLPCARIDSAF